MQKLFYKSEATVHPQLQVLKTSHRSKNASTKGKRRKPYDGALVRTLFPQRKSDCGATAAHYTSD